MPAVPADLCIEARWIVPMTTPDSVLENHALVVRDGRILDLLPQAAAAGRYAPTVTVQRPAHLLMPGMINAATHAAKTLFRGTPKDAAALERRFVGPEFARDWVLTAIAQMLRAGITCFADRYYFPDQTARAAGEQGMRVVVGMPVAETASPWAGCSADYLTRALAVRDEYKGHPLISTAFATRHSRASPHWRMNSTRAFFSTCTNRATRSPHPSFFTACARCRVSGSWACSRRP